jgi:cysteinyl-tRNA synthetase
LDGQDDKKGKLDFALWIKAKPEHIMKWTSPWGEGFPGWHLECSAMSRKYLGDTFDIHGGGMDLVPTHHTNEIAQNNACCKTNPANYWVHTNMLTVNGQKMSKSLGNSFLPHELFSGNHPLLDKGYTANVVRFFMLQTHYSSTLDFSNEALQAAEKGFKRLMAAYETLQNLKSGNTSTSNIAEWKQKCYDAMNDDFNTPILLAQLFESVRIINSVNAGTETITEADLELLKKTFTEFITNVLGLVVDNEGVDHNADVLDGVVKILIEMRANAKQNKDFATSDKIRDELTKNNIQLKDSKDGTTWNLA